MAEIKLKDFLLELAKVGGIQDTDFDAALSASGLAEINISDSFKEKFNKAFLTRERAQNDPDIVTGIQKQTRAEVFNRVDDGLKNLYGFVDDETKTNLEKTFETYKRIEMLKEGLDKGLKTKQSKASSEDVRKIEEEWSNKLKSAQAEHANSIKDITTKHKNESLNYALMQKFNDFKISDQFTTVKPQLAESIINKVRNYQHNGNKTVIEMATDGQLHLRQEVDGSLRDIFTEGNNKMTLESLLQKELEPFVVKSNGNGNNGNGGGGNPPRKEVQLPANPTLSQLRVAGAQ